MKPFSARRWKKRMFDFMEMMGIRRGMTILDLVGQPMIWDSVGPE
ncbi:MAG: hypothetical protein ACKVP4_02395 [Hyphomicrobium sp.]